MTRNNTGEWVEAYIEAEEDISYSPRELRARALYYAVLGYSSREIEGQLKSDFPGERVPPFGVIARWNRSRPANRIGMLRLFDVLHRASLLLQDHMEAFEPSSSNMLEAFSLYERVHALYANGRLALLYK